MSQWSGDDWQSYSDELFIARHGADYQRIPDELGDYGAEGFTCGGDLVQAYAAEEVSESKKLYEAQRDKVTRDLGKIVKNKDKFKAMIGGPIKRMILMVPEVRTKDLLEHCAAKAKEICHAAHAEFAPDFDIRVLTGDDFPEERRRLGEAVGLAIGVEPETVTDDDLVAWSASNSKLSDNLERKLGDVQNLSDSQRAQLGAALIRLYLRREEVLRQLRTNFPALWEALRAEVVGREQALAAENLLNPMDPHERIRSLATELEDRLVAAVPSIRASGTDLGWGTVAEWLLRCPLELRAGVPT